VTIPLRGAAAAILLFRRRWRAAAAFILTWAASEILLTSLKAWFHRGRPPVPLVITHGYSFPSGHAIAASAIGVALVLAFMGAGPRRRKWEWLAVGFTFVMAFSRVYLRAHWLSDVVAGVLLGTGIALASFGLVTEIVSVARRRSAQAVGAADDPATDASGPPAVSRGS
jgi:undecaprenyl-diphosphatase